jgi:hypothetical protein
VNNSNTSRAIVAPNGVVVNERRRIAKYIRDDRGNVTVEWHGAPPGYQRFVLKIMPESPGAPAPERRVNPYHMCR